MPGIEELVTFSKENFERTTQNNVLADLEEILKNFFWKLNDNAQYEEDTYGGKKELGFHPSAVCDEVCARRMVYGYLKVPFDSSDMEGIDPLLRRVFDNGHHVHSRWQTYFTILSQTFREVELIGNFRCKGCGYLYPKNKEGNYRDMWKDRKIISCPVCNSRRWKYAEYKLQDKCLKLVGKRDVKLLINKVPYLVEIKSINMFQYQKLLEPLLKHKKQFALYMYMDETKEGIFLYECKNSQNMKLFYMKYDENLIKEELKILEIASKAVDKKELPIQMKGFPNLRECKLCNYKKLCKSEKTYKEIIKEIKGKDI